MTGLLLTLLLVPRPVLSGVEQTAASANQPFLVHYTASGDDAVLRAGDPLAVVAGLDAVMAHWVGSAGMRAPLSDGGGGGDARIDVYLRKLDGPRGNTWPEDVGAARGESAWIEIDTRAPAPRLVAAAGHEAHHAIEYAYTTTLARWIYEATAAYVEHADFSGGGLEAETDAHWAAILAHPEIPLDRLDGVHEYDELAFVKFLVDRTGDDSVLARLWEAMAEKGDVIDGVEKVTALPIAGVLLAFASLNRHACAQDQSSGYRPPARCSTPHAPRVVGAVALPSTLEIPLPPLSMGYVQAPSITDACSAVRADIADPLVWFTGVDALPFNSTEDAGSALRLLMGVDPLIVLARGRTGPLTATLSLSLEPGHCNCLNGWPCGGGGSGGGCGCALRGRLECEHACMFAIGLIFVVLFRRRK